MFAWKVPFYIYNVIIFFVKFFALGYKLFADWSIFYLKEMASESNDIIIIQLQKKKNSISFCLKFKHWKSLKRVHKQSFIDGLSARNALINWMRKWCVLHQRADKNYGSHHHMQK